MINRRGYWTLSSATQTHSGIIFSLSVREVIGRSPLICFSVIEIAREFLVLARLQAGLFLSPLPPSASCEGSRSQQELGSLFAVGDSGLEGEQAMSVLDDAYRQ
jgi:hypothetical protein